MNKTLLLFVILFHSVLRSQTFNGYLGSQTLNWNMDQKDFTTPPRIGIAPMSIKLWDNYNGASAPSQYGTLLEINGRESHLHSQLYFTGSGGNDRIIYRSAFYAQSIWQEWRYLLDSKSDVESSGNLKIAGTGNSYIATGNLSIGTYDVGFQSKLYARESGTSNSVWRGRIIASGDKNAVVMGEYDGKAWFGAHNSLLNAWSDLIIQGGGGNVGIGTSNPTSKLTVAGNINSREVKVTVDAGADFVFENNYNLPSLDVVEKFIKENKHLPEIASADEMKKEGINLSEMNIKLLQKIEEMTLYMIEQNKKIIDLENRLKKVETK